MKLRSTKLRISVFNILAGSSLLALASAADAQTASGPNATATPSFALEEIIVTARRKSESIEDVPTTVNAVSGAEIEKLDIRKFEDIASVVPGLTMGSNANGIGATASVRGVNYDVNASGNNGTVEFYLNDAPISAGNLFQAVYDIQQVELLRGPQGTLRGRASPSGSMTVTTRHPDLKEMGGYVNATANNIGGYNGQGAFSTPIIPDILGIRVAGVYDKNEGNRVHSINNPTDPSFETKSGRATISFVPTDNLSFILTAQKTRLNGVSFDQVESQQVINPNAPVIPSVISPPLISGGVTFVPAVNNPTPPPYITADQRLAVEATPVRVDQNFNNYNLQIQWAFLGQKLNYVGARNEQAFSSFAPGDVGGYYAPAATAYQGFGQQTDSHANATASELRLSSEERIAGIFDYNVGVFYQKLNAPTDLTSATPVFNPFAAPPVPPEFINLTPISVRNSNEEKSGFVNLTAHLGDAWELSGGGRYIKYSALGTLSVAGNQVAAANQDQSYTHTIYMGSVKYNVTQNFMTYASVGTSWRPGISAVGDFSLIRSPLENSFLVLDPETSTSYEVGFKSAALDKRLRTDVSFYHQKFTNYPYRSTAGVWFIETDVVQPVTNPPAFTQGPHIFNFVAAVPVEVNGVEAEVNFAATHDWDLGASGSFSKGEIKNGFIPCNDFAPHDGVPDSGGAVPTLAQLQAAVGAGTISGCNVTQRSSSAPQWSATLQSEYRVPITSELNSFVRGLVSLYGSSKNDPLNPNDDVSAYALLNLYVGVHSASGAWEVSLYGKNITNTERVLSLSGNTETAALNAGAQPTNYYGGTATSGLTMTAPREFGINLRYAFGSR